MVYDYDLLCRFECTFSCSTVSAFSLWMIRQYKVDTRRDYGDPGQLRVGQMNQHPPTSTLLISILSACFLKSYGQSCPVVQQTRVMSLDASVRGTTTRLVLHMISRAPDNMNLGNLGEATGKSRGIPGLILLLDLPVVEFAQQGVAREKGTRTK